MLDRGFGTLLGMMDVALCSAVGALYVVPGYIELFCPVCNSRECWLTSSAAAQNVGKYYESAEKDDSSAGVTKVVTGCGKATLNC